MAGNENNGQNKRRAVSAPRNNKMPAQNSISSADGTRSLRENQSALNGKRSVQGSRKAPEGKRPVQSSRKAPEEKRPVQSSRKAPEEKRPVQSSRKAPEGKRPVQGSRKAPEGKHPVQGSQKVPEGKRPVQGSQKAPKGKRPVQGSRKAPEGKRPVQGLRKTPEEKSPVQGKQPIRGGLKPTVNKPSPDVLRGSRMAAKIMRQKKAAPQSNKFKGGNYVLYYLLAAVILMITFIILANTVLFRCSKIEVKGSERYTDDEIAAASGVQLGDNLMRINELQTEDKIVNALAYIDKAEVKKSFPKKLLITVTEGEKWFCVSENNITVAVSRGGKIIEITLPEKLPVIRGYEAESIEPGKWLKSKTEEKTDLPRVIFTAADEAGLNKITEIDLTDRFNIKVVVDGRINLELGPITDVDTKLKVAQKIISTQIGETEYVTLLLTNPEKVPSITNTPPTSSSSVETSSTETSSSENENGVEQPPDENNEDDIGNGGEAAADGEPWEEPDAVSAEDPYNEPGDEPDSDGADNADGVTAEDQYNEPGDEPEGDGGWGDAADYGDDGDNWDDYGAEDAG